MALPSSLSAFMGITEPAIFGVNMRFFKPFICACIGGGLGAMFASISGLGASGTGVTGIFGILLCLHAPVKYILMFVIAAASSFALTWLFGYKDTPRTETNAPSSSATAAPVSSPTPVSSSIPEVRAPLTGKAVTLQETGDETFAQELLGKGCAIEPSEGLVTAPFDGEVTVLMGHAVGLMGSNGVEILVHVGIDTVRLEGKHYTPYVKEGDQVRAGQKLLGFDIAAIQKEGYRTITPVIVTNSDDFASVQAKTGVQVRTLDELITISK